MHGVPDDVDKDMAFSIGLRRDVVHENDDTV